MVPLSYLQIHLDRGAWCPTRSPARYSDHQHARAVCVQVPVVGITHRVCQLGALVYVIFNMYSGNGWAYSEVPLGSVNPWGAAQRVETGWHSCAHTVALQLVASVPGTSRQIRPHTERPSPSSQLRRAATSPRPLPPTPTPTSNIGARRALSTHEACDTKQRSFRRALATRRI